MESALPYLLIAQGALAGVDTVLNHELLARLPQRPAARPEVGLHVLREAIWATLFLGLAWFEWHGAAALAIAALIAAEIVITACDEFVENRIRVLPQNERVLHLFLALNVGLVVAALVPLLFAWAAEPTGLVRRDHGLLSWAISAFAAAAAFWSVRDFFTWRKLK